MNATGEVFTVEVGLVPAFGLAPGFKLWKCVRPGSSQQRMTFRIGLSASAPQQGRGRCHVLGKQRSLPILPMCRVERLQSLDLD